MKEFKVPLNEHAQDLADGRVVAPGERIKLSDDEVKDEHHARLFAEGKLISVSEEGEDLATKAARSHGRAVAEKEGGDDE